MLQYFIRSLLCLVPDLSLRSLQTTFYGFPEDVYYKLTLCEKTPVQSQSLTQRRLQLEVLQSSLRKLWESENGWIGKRDKTFGSIFPATFDVFPAFRFPDGTFRILSLSILTISIEKVSKSHYFKICVHENGFPHYTHSVNTNFGLQRIFVL